MKIEEQLRGLSFVEAVKVAARLGYSCRVVKSDEFDYPATTDVRADRVSLTLVDRKVTKVEVG